MADITYDLIIKSGLPYSKSFLLELPSGRSWWTMASQFEHVGQIRKKKDRDSELILDISTFISVTTVNADTYLFELKMTGQDTRTLTESGAYDIIVSDTGITDGRAIELSVGKVKRLTVISANVVGEA